MPPPRFERLLAPAKRLIFAAFVLDLGAACVMLALQFKGIKLQASPFVLGLLGSSLFIVYPFITAASGHLSDRLGRRSITLAASGVCLTAWAGMALARTVWQLLPLGVMSGIGLALIWPPVEAWLADLSGGSARALNRNLGLFNIAWTSGLMVGPLVAGQAWETYGEATFLVAAAGALVCFISALTTPTPPPAVEHVAPPAHVDDRRVKSYLVLAWVALGAAVFGRGLIAACFPKLGDELHFSHALVGRLQFALAAGQVAAFMVMRATTVWQYRRWPLFVPPVVGLAMMIVAALTDSPAVFAVSFVLIGATVGVGFMCGLTYAMQAEPAERGKRAGLHEAIMGVGLFLGPLLGGAVAQWQGLHAPYLLGAGIFLCAGLAQAMLRRTAGRQGTGS